jgi:uncharacterized protein DUF4349
MRLRRTDTIDPAIERELQALDAALAGAPVEAEHEELRDLAVALQAARPVAPPSFGADLDARVAAGFASTQRQRRRPRRRVAPLALGTGAAAFIVAVAVTGSGIFIGGGDEQGGAPKGRTAAAPSQARDEGSLIQKSAPLAAPGPQRPSGPAARPRKVERGASITLAAPRDDVESVADGVIRTADRYGGFVRRSSVKSGDRNARAEIDLRFPTSHLEDAIADISELAHVRARSQRALDITARFSYPRRELADATAERRSLLAALARATTANEAASIRARLRIANDRIDAARATLRRLQNRVTYSSVSVSVEGGAVASDGVSWSAGDAFGSALDVLEVSLGVAIVALAALVPLTLLLALALLGRRAYLDHARNAALDAVENRPAR